MRPTATQLCTALLGLLIATVTASALFGAHGIRHLRELRADRRQLGRGAVRLLQENAALRDEIDRLQHDPFYVEAVVRRETDLVRPGEVVYRFRRVPRSEPRSRGR